MARDSCSNQKEPYSELFNLSPWRSSLSYFEYVGIDYEGDMKAMGDDPKTQEWWSLTIPMQAPMEDRAEGEWWKTLPEVFHTD